MKVLFLVNGPEWCADGIRSISLARHLPSSWTISHSFRDDDKRKSLQTFLGRAFAERPDVIVVVKMAYSGVLAGLAAKYLLGCKLICDTGDVAYALSKSTGRYSRLAMALIWIVEKAGSHLSDWIVTRGTYHKELLATWNLENVTVIPDGVETSVEVPRDGKAVRERLGLVGKVVIGMIGSMDWSERDKQCYGWDVVEVLAYLRDLPVAVLMVGDGSGRPILEARVAELGVTSLVHFVGRLPYEELAEYLGAMDICVSTQSNNLVGMVRTTGKLPLYLAHDKFIIATNVGEARRVLPEVGILLPFEGARDPAHPERLAATIRALVAEPARFRLGGAARKVAIEEFEYTVLGARLQDVIERAATGRRRGVPVTQGLVTEQGKQ